MSDITISVIQPPSTTINVGVDETTLIQAGISFPTHSVTHISGGSDELNHNLLAGLQGGSGGQYYHLSSGEYGNLVFTTGNQTISGAKTFANNLTVNGGDLFVDTSNNRVGVNTVSPTATLDVNGSGIFRSGLFVNNITARSSDLNIRGLDTGNLAGGGGIVTVRGGSGLFVGGPVTLEGGTGNFVGGKINIYGGSNGNIPNGSIDIQSTNTIFNSSNAYSSNVVFYKTGLLFATDNVRISQNSISINNNLLINGNRPTVNGTGVLLSGEAYANSNPSGFITGINNIVYTTGDQIISGAKTFTGSFNVSTNDAIIIRSTGYTNGVEIGGGYFNKIADGGFTNDFGVGGAENHFGDSATSSNSFGGSAVQNDFGAYATLNNYYAGFGIGQFDFDTRPTVSGTGVLLEGEIPDTGYLSGYVNKNETGDFYPRTNPSGYISGINNLVFTTGNQTISGAKTFSNNLTVNGGDLFVDTSNSRVGVNTVSPTATLDVNGSGIFRSGLNVNLITSTGSDFYLSGKNNAFQIFSSNFIGGFVSINAGSGNFAGGSISLKGGNSNPGTPGGVSLIGGSQSNSSIPEGAISLQSKNIEFNKINSYSSNTIFYKTGSSVITENINISQDSISINNNLLITGSRPTVNSTGILLSGEATTQAYVTGISGGLQTQITTLNNQTGNYYTKDESESRYVNTTGAETILGNKTFHDNVYINNLYVTGLETIVNTTNTNVASNYIMLNLTGGAVDGGIFFVTGSGLTGINDSGAIIGFDHSDEFKFGISTRASDLSTLNTIASVEQMTGISGGLQTQISTLNNQTGSYVLKIESGQFYPNSNPSGFITGVDLSTYATQNYVTGISGGLQTQITDLSNATGSYVLNSQTGQFYANSNPSGFITGINDLVYTTGDQSISGNLNISGNLTISGVYNIYQQIENAKILSIAYAIAL